MPENKTEKKPFSLYFQDKILLYLFLLNETLWGFSGVMRLMDQEIETTDEAHLFTPPWGFPKGHLDFLLQLSLLTEDNSRYKQIQPRFKREIESVFQLGKSWEITKGQVSGDELRASLKQIVSLLLELLPTWEKDSKVLLFLLNKRERIDAVLGNGYTLSLFNFLFPKGLNSAQEWMTGQFTQRRYDHILPLIAKKIVELSKANE